MAEYPAWRRRLTALGVLLLAAGALIATSPPLIQSSLEASHSGTAELTLEAPRATGRVRLDLSAAALPAADDRDLRVSGTVGFYVRNPNTDVRMRVSALGTVAAAAETEGSTSWPIEQLCRVAEPCQREFEVTFEWLDPQPAVTQRGSFEATVRIVYDRVETNPDGAAADWSDTMAFVRAPAGPVLSAGTIPERLTLDRAHRAALRHVVLSAPEFPESARTAAFIRSSPAASGAEAVRFVLLPDDPADGGAASDGAIDPFATCPETGSCERGVTVLIELAEIDPDATAAIEWSLQVQAELPPATAIPEDGKLSALVDRSVEVAPDTPAVTARASGTLEPGTYETGGTLRSFTRVIIATEDAALRLGTSAALPPPAVGVLVVRAADDVTVDIHVAGDRGTTFAYQPLALGPSRPSATVLVFPLRACDAGSDCTVELWLSATTATPADGGDRVVSVGWDLDLQVLYPGLDEPPSGARVRIDVRVDDR